ncbi:centrosomal protein of 192 kDa isoform X1 [Pleuronectes platessa]|uniref:centrosomal protein of 192 kDa isoform X1 n=2 Tax=Pleuronectes platessa TaxID=8262 RepID=UPI00232A55B8|nr:centrosomal protein of 192 kDa isoform X1 [Pleuronectes platessa]XP_053287862.1 centrosomal protein of 192 kDa isoform X1 [Pleuronectes platessa]XP_053287863.1 centrosomal protein of 192 kDa isoform X1 [Pleuronectes platessa]
MAGYYKLEDEVLPSFLCESMDSSSGRATLGNVTLGSGPGLPVAASTVAKIRPSSDNREDHWKSYLDENKLKQASSQPSVGEQPKFALSFKDELDKADDFIAAHRLSDMLVKINLDDSGSQNQGSIIHLHPTQIGSVHGWPAELGTDLSTGLLALPQYGHKDNPEAKASSAIVGKDNVQSEGVDSDHFSGSNSSFLANERLMSVDSMNSDITDDTDFNNLPDDELELYFNKLVPPAMQRGRVEGQELVSTEDFMMPDVRLAATGMDSCPASDEDTEDELESARRNNDASRTRLLSSTSRQLVGESNCPSFRPGLEGGSSDDEYLSGRSGPSVSGIEHRRSAEGQVINPPVTGDGGGGDGSSGSEESGNYAGASTIPPPTTNVQTTYDALRGLGIVGSSAVGEDEDKDLNNLVGHGRNSLSRHTEIGHRVGPVGIGEATSSWGMSLGTQKPSPVNWSMVLDRQETLDAMESTETGPTVDRFLDSVYLRNRAGLRRPQDVANMTFSHLQGTQGSFHLSQVLLPEFCDKDGDDNDDYDHSGVDEPDSARPSLGLRGGPCGDVTTAEASGGTSEDDTNPLSTSLEPKYFSQSFHQEQEDSDEWNHCPDNLELEFQQGARTTHNVVYQNEEGQWVTDLAYYSSFEKEVDGKTSETAGQFHTEDFVDPSSALEKLAKDEEEFEKEHQFIQEEKIELINSSTFQSDSLWKVPSNSLMRASQVTSEFNQGDQSYLRLSLGEFFGQRSEALGCLGSISDVDGTKRPSFGYIITSPEKREPFPLINPQRVVTSPHIDTMELSEGDKTLNPEDLEKTLEAPGEMISPKGDIDQESSEQEDHSVSAALPDHSEGSPESILGSQTGATLDNNSSHLMLSISTIASAIADASISTDPSQLAAMIMALSKKSKMRNQPMDSVPSNSTEDQHSAENILYEPDESAMLDTLQTRTYVGEPSAFDLEKYLKTTDVSCPSDASFAQTTFDLTRWAHNLSTNPQTGYPADQNNSFQRVYSETQKKASAVSLSNSLSPGNSVSKRSPLPCPHTSFSSAGMSMRSGPSSMLKIPANKTAACDRTISSATKTCGSTGSTSTDNGVKAGEQKPPGKNNTGYSLDAKQKSDDNSSSSTGLPRTFPGWRKGQSGLPYLKGCSPPSQGMRTAGQQHQDRLSNSLQKKPLSRNIVGTPLPCSSEEKKNVGSPSQKIWSSVEPASELPKGFSEPCGEETQCNFRPSTSPLTHSSPSQTSIPSANGECLTDKRPGLDLSSQSTCSSPSLSRLTYISMNDGTVIPTPERQKNNCTMALSTTIIRFSPTPPVGPDEQSNLDIPCSSKSIDQLQPQHSKSLDPLPATQCKTQEPSRSGSALSCTRSQSECNYHCARDRTSDLSAGCRTHRHLSESNVRQLTKVDSGYCSNLNIQQTRRIPAPQSSQQWGAASSALSSVIYAGGLGVPLSCSSEGFHYVPIPSFKPQCTGFIDLPHQGDVQSLLTGCSLYNSQLAQHYLGSEAPLHPGAYPVGPTGSGLYSVSSTGTSNNDPTVRHTHPPSGPLEISAAAGSLRLPRLHQNQQDIGIIAKPYSHHDAEPLGTGGLEELRGQVVVPGEVRFPNACCVGIASQTSLSLFNPSERWQQVSITVTSLAIDGEKVEGLPYQWLIVKNKTIIGPKSTEEQKVLFIAPQAGVYECVLTVWSWPASAEIEVAARANSFAKRVVLIAIAENPAVEVEESKFCYLDFGDLPGGSAKSLPLKLVNKTHATVPIRLVISANATASRCFTFSKQPVVMTPEETQQAGHITPVSSPSVINHVMPANYGENTVGFMVWVHFKAPQKYTFSGELGPPVEYLARVDIELDSPGPSHVIRSIPLSARSGTARVHAPKDLQNLRLSAPLGISSKQMLPLKNAGNIDVQLKLESSDAEGSFSVTPDELFLRVGDEQEVTVSFKAQKNRKNRESLLTILVLPSGPQYEVTLKGEVVPEDSGKPAVHSSSAFGSGLTKDIPPILSNKQFIAWGGVSLGRAVQQKLVLRNNSTNVTQQLRLLIRGQDQDCFQLQSMFSPEERLTRHGELSIRPREDVAVHLLFAPTRVASMLSKLEIKQSGVQPSQPGVKFTIPLSGYGGTNNIILEDQRKQADSYVATLTNIAIGRVSKVCLCVRNTGSRAAFIKAVAFTDMQTRSVLEPSVISLAPSQFVLKERTQEVITVLMKSTQREHGLCQSVTALLATVCLFCGDEVSRQQYRRLLQSKPEAAQQALSENSLLKNINFNEKFLGEENVTETCDLPQRPNEAHIFYGNMSKVVVSLLGSRKNTACDDRDHTELQLPPARQDSETDCGLVNGGVSLDVLPVKGPQGPALRVTETSLKASNLLRRKSDSWTIHPEQLVLTTPTISGAATTSQIQICNNTSRELSFDLSWPAHCLTITPQHGVIEPQCHLQIWISPNPSLTTKSALLPWSGQVYVQCDGRQKFIKVQIRQDLALDVSAASSDRTLSALPPHAATPILPVARLITDPSLALETPQAQVEISNKSIIFATTPTGETSEAKLEVQNGQVEVRWYLSSFAPPYVKGVDNTGDVYRATYTAFTCSRVSGILGANEKMQVPMTFLPRDRGDYAQFWDLECHPVSEPQQKTRTRFQLCGTGVKSGSVEEPQEGDSTVVKKEPTVKTRKGDDASAGKKRQEETVWRGVYSPQDLYTFPATRVGESNTLKVSIRNNSSSTHELKFVNTKEPFHIKHSKYSLRSQHYLKLPIQFRPSTAGRHASLLLIKSETSESLVIQLIGEAMP